MIITSYYIDNNKTLHTFCGQLKHVTFSDVQDDDDAMELIAEENKLLNS